ncbi:MAG TPA: DUF1080 domain-containing protein [Flavitalea sp.]|nr:DUF1080 domain-containing protein [Flavitalea sp.]
MRIFLTVILFGLLTACGSSESETQPKTDSETNATAMDQAASENNILSDAEQAEGWHLLFDGVSLNGWHGYNNKSDASAWKVEDGAIWLDSSHKKDGKPFGRGDIVTNVEFTNFHLKLDWKIGSAGNSGIIFYVNEDPQYDQTYLTGPEMQVLDNNGHADAKIIKHRAGDLYDLISSSPETVKPAGEWNQAEIIANNGDLEFRLNGTSVLKTTMWNDQWKELIAGSKFKNWKGFGTFKTGHIALQDHGDPVWYRNIKIKRL